MTLASTNEAIRRENYAEKNLTSLSAKSVLVGKNS
jgi:hypothetical protein